MGVNPMFQKNKVNKVKMRGVTSKYFNPTALIPLFLLVSELGSPNKLLFAKFGEN